MRKNKNCNDRKKYLHVPKIWEGKCISANSKHVTITLWGKMRK